jgi:hypothetical protein
MIAVLRGKSMENNARKKINLFYWLSMLFVVSCLETTLGLGIPACPWELF